MLPNYWLNVRFSWEFLVMNFTLPRLIFDSKNWHLQPLYYNIRWHYLFNKSNPEEEDNFVKKPWHKPTDRRALRGNDALEAFIFRCHEQLFDPDKRRKINDNLTPDQRAALRNLMNFFADHGIIVRFEDKGSRFVLNTIANHDAALLVEVERWPWWGSS